MHRLRFACAGVLLLSVAGCGGAAAQPDAAASPKDTKIRFVLSTTSGSIGQNHDDEYCVWATPEYVLRDGDGSMLAEGEATSNQQGSATIGDEPAQLGVVTSEDPYRCEFMFLVDAPPADFYEVTVTTQRYAGFEGRSEEVESVETFSREDAADRVVVEVSA